MNCLNVSIEHSFLCRWLLRYPCLFLCDILTTLSDDHSVYSFGESPQAVSSLGSTRKSHRFDKSNRGNSSKALRKGRIAESESTESEQSSKEADSMDEDSSIQYTWKYTRIGLLLSCFISVWSKLCDEEPVVFDEKKEEAIRQDLLARLDASEVDVLIQYLKRRVPELM